MDRHEQKLKRLCIEVTAFYKRKQPFYIYHGSTNATRHVQFKRNETIDISSLNEVLSIDENECTVTVEPNVSMDTLVQATLAYGMVPQVVMEFPGITVGGGIQGFAGESSSYKSGVFNATCASVELVLGDGQVLTASPTQNSDLFYGSAGSFGSLGILTCATIKLMPSKKYVALTYVPVNSFEKAVKTIELQTKEANYDYIDGIMFSKNYGVILLGTLTEEKIGPKVRFSRSYDNWFYLHAQKISKQHAQYTESIPLADYLFRYDRGAFWVGRFPFERAGLPFNRFTRWLVNPMLHTRKLYQALHDSGASQQYVIQDLALPVYNAAEFMDYIDRKFKTYPQWLCPLKLENDWIMMRENTTETVINVGVWDNHPFYDYDKFVAANRDLEAKLRTFNGQKWFYAHAYYTEDEFWSIYNKSRYEKLRKKYHAETLPTVYEKIRSKGQRSVHIKKSSLRTLFGMAKLKIEE